jgi:hypothetical protein
MLEYKEVANPQRANPMPEDKMGEFLKAVNNGQTRMALDYAAVIIDALVRAVEELQKEVSKPPSASTAQSRKVTKSKEPSLNEAAKE